MGDGRGGKRDMQTFCRVHDDVQILVVETTAESGCKIIANQFGPPNVHDPRLGIAATQNLDNDRRIDPRLGSQAPTPPPCPQN